MVRYITAILALLSLACIGMVSTQPVAVAKNCPEGKVQKVVPGIGQIVCVSVTQQSGKERTDRNPGTGDVWVKPKLPDGSGVRKESDLPTDEKDWNWHETMYYSETQDPCWGIDAPAEYLDCQATQWLNDGDEGTQSAVDPEEAVERVMARLRFSAAVPQVGPSRDHHNFPFDTAVGYPVWLWATGATTDKSVTEAVGSTSVTLSIQLDQITWDLGDNTEIRCDEGTEWRPGESEPGRRSPTCGHVYEKPGKYTVEATTHWIIAWNSGGESGTIPYSLSLDRQVEVGEIHVLVR